MTPVNPNLQWYVAISERKGLLPRCPFASVHRCPRYYQSLSLLGDAGFTKVDPGEDKALLESWRQSDLWPATSEQATSIFKAGNKACGYSRFCPEVCYDSFGLFATDLHRYTDDLDIDLAHSALGKEGAKKDDWRWAWWTVSPQHYSECPLYSPLLHDAPRQATGPSPPRVPQDRILEVKPSVYGIKLDLHAVWARVLCWWRARKGAS
jgi:hypothetical protein